MGEPEHVVERNRYHIGPDGPVVVDGGLYPAVHVRGMSVHLTNAAAQAVLFYMQDSDDAQTWAIALFSTPTAANQLSLTMVGLSQAAILLATRRRYLRFAAVPAAGPADLYLVCSQFIPLGPVVPVAY